MKESIQAFDYAGHIAKQLQDGQVLLSTRAEKFNSMVTGWGHLGVIWNLPTFTVYVRQSRYTLSQLDRTGEFTVSLPVEGRLDKEIFRVCGSLSGKTMTKPCLTSSWIQRSSSSRGIQYSHRSSAVWAIRR